MAKKFKVPVVVVYAPVNRTNRDRDSKEFYPQLQEPKDRVEGRNMLILFGYFNTQVGRNTNRDRWHSSTDKFVAGKKSNGYKLLKEK